MSIAQSMLPEFQMEMEATRKVLERIPQDRLEWRPHEKSWTTRELATHLANLPTWTAITLQTDGFDLDADGPAPQEPQSVDGILSLFDENASAATAALSGTGDETFMESWTLTRGDDSIFSTPKIGVMRRFVLNHLIHHRGQMTVYLRLAGAPVPQTFGPTADEPDFTG